MDYRTGSIGRVIVMRFNDGDDLVGGLTEVARKEDIRSAIFHVVGGLKRGSFVVGPEEEKMPPKPVWRELNESHEILGTGTIFWDDEGPKIHLHAAYGKRDAVRTGCLRKDSEVFLIIEAVIFELKGIDARRIPDAATGLSLLGFAG
ncbi:MAG TPA: DNA-binding protein [Nitrospirae bacterium]|nr:DNA-binding protein [Nitrospirota bacterium]